MIKRSPRYALVLMLMQALGAYWAEHYDQHLMMIFASACAGFNMAVSMQDTK